MCKLHGGGAKQVREKAERRVIEQEVRAEMQTLGIVQDDVDPAQELILLVARKAAEIAWLRSKVVALEDGDLAWGVTQHEEGVGPEGPIDKSTSKAEANVWWRLLREAEDQHARYCALALKAGVAQRQLELQETQALVLAEAVRRILDQLELSQHQAALVSTVVPQVLRTLPVGETK